MATSQSEFSKRIQNSLAVSDPNMSVAVGTPQRKIIEAVASTLALASSEYSATYFTGFLDSYSGTDLDAYVEQFGFSRQLAGYASGSVTVKRSNASSVLSIPYGTTFYKPSTTTESDIYFSSTVGVDMAVGVVSAQIPVVCTVAGTIGNVLANTVVYTDMFAQSVEVTNLAPMTGGYDRETDDVLKYRFRNTLFRNMAGTKDQYLGLALANTYTSRAKIVGEVSTYEEIVSVSQPQGQLKESTMNCTDFLRLVDTDRIFVRKSTSDTYLGDSDYNVVGATSQKVTYNSGTITSSNGYTIGPFDTDGFSWLQHENVSSLVLQLPISDSETYIVPNFADVETTNKIYQIADSASGKILMNYWSLIIVPSSFSAGVYSVLNGAKFLKFSVSGSATLPEQNSRVWIYSTDGENTFYPSCCTSANVVDGGWDSTNNRWETDDGCYIEVLDVSPTGATVLQIAETSNFDLCPIYKCSYSYQPVSVGEFVTMACEYYSDRWRQGKNSVDVYVDGQYPIAVEDIGVIDKTNNVISSVGTPSLLGGAFKREDGTLPQAGNYFIYLAYQPVFSVDDTITIGAGIILDEGVDYWIVHEDERAGTTSPNYSLLNRGSGRASDFIEINHSSTKVANIVNGTPVHIGYAYNQAVEQVQILVDAQSPVCTDALVHEAKRRYVEVCLTVMYSSYTSTDMKDKIDEAVQAFFNKLPFGSVVQFSDVETVVANIAGVDNVRITTSADVSAPSPIPSGSELDYKFGIIEYQRDNATYKQRFTNDFRTSQDEVVTVVKTTVITKTQAGW